MSGGMNDYHSMWKQAEDRITELEEALREMVRVATTVSRGCDCSACEASRRAQKVLDHDR